MTCARGCGLDEPAQLRFCAVAHDLPLHYQWPVVRYSHAREPGAIRKLVEIVARPCRGIGRAHVEPGWRIRRFARVLRC